MNPVPMMAEPDTAAGVLAAQRGADTADATDAAARLWRDAGGWIRSALPDPFTVADIRDVLAQRHLIANDGTEELRCLGTWPQRLGARKIATRTVTTRPGGHASHRAVWSFRPSPLTVEPPVAYAENARDVLLASKADLVRQIAERTMQLDTARAALRWIADSYQDHPCADFAHSQWALTDPHRQQSATGR